MKSGVYKITNLINGKFYIGSSKDLNRRKKDHFRILSKGTSHNKILQNAVNKYGIINFKFEIIENCTEELLFITEQKFVDELKPQYNISIANVAVPTGLPYKDKSLYKKYAEDRLKENNNFGWKSRKIVQLDSKNGNIIKEFSSLKEYADTYQCSIGNVGSCIKRQRKCKGFYIKYKE